MKAAKRTLLRCALVAVLVIAASAVASAQSRTFDRTLPATGVSEIRVKGHVGEIRMNASSGNNIVVNLVVESKDYSSFWGRRRGDPDKAELVAEASAGVARLEVRTPEDSDGLKEYWRIDVPARLAAHVSLNVGDVEVNGVAGGLDAKVNVGDLRIDIPQGNVEAEANVGSVRVTTATSSYGDVNLKSNVGDARITLNNHRVKYERAPGAGHRVSLEGTGRDRIRLRVNVGDADLTIRPTV